MQDAGEAPAPLIALWRALALRRPFALGRPLRESEIAWAIETGMAPLLLAAIRGAPAELPPALAPRLEAADRWARIQSAETLEAAAEILDRCAGRMAPPTLLKGLSTGGQYYPEPYQRFLGDLDLLVEPADAAAAVTGLRELGYREPAAGARLDYTGHHHLPPLRHPRIGLSVELHTALFPSSQQLDAEGPFAPATLRSERRPATLDGRPVFRLSPELQILYTASHWALDFVPESGPRALLDMVLLLRAESRRLGCARILSWLDDSRIAAHLQLALGYLESKGLVVPPQELHSESERWAPLDARALAILWGMVDRYQIRGEMRRVRHISSAETLDRAPAVGASGSLRSRLGTLRAAVGSRNLRGLLPILDSALWTALLQPKRPASMPVLSAWCALFPPGDPHRFSPIRRLRRS